MQLQACLGQSLMFTRGHSDAARAALNRSLAIAEARADLLNEVRLLGLLHMYHLRGGDFKTSLQYAKRSSEIASTLGDAGATALAHALMGISLHLMGNLNDARVELEAALEPGPDSPISRTTYFGFDHYRFSSTALTTTLWLQGHPAKATALRPSIDQRCRADDDPVSLAIMLNSVALLLWTGDLDFAEQQLDWFISRAESQYFGPYLDVGHGLRGELAIRRGEVKAGVEMLRSCLEKLHAARYGFFTTRFHIGARSRTGGQRTVLGRLRRWWMKRSSGLRRRATPLTCRSFCV